MCVFCGAGAPGPMKYANFVFEAFGRPNVRTEDRLFNLTFVQKGRFCLKRLVFSEKGSYLYKKGHFSINRRVFVQQRRRGIIRLFFYIKDCFCKKGLIFVQKGSFGTKKEAFFYNKGSFFHCNTWGSSWRARWLHRAHTSLKDKTKQKRQ